MLMHTLYLTNYGENRMQATRAVRNAMRALGLSEKDASYAAADKLLDALDRDGYALLGTSPNPTLLTEVSKSLAAADCEAVLNLDPERAARRSHSREDRGAGKTPEQVFAERAPGEPTVEFRFSPQASATAMAMLAMTDGNPLNAAAFVHRLDHTTGDALWEEVQEALIQAFPFIGQALEENRMRLRSFK